MQNEKPTTGGPSSSPRLLDLDGASAYTGIPYWSLRRLAASGALPVVRLPRPGATDGRVMRRILFDRSDLDRLIDANKERLSG
jgi:hypothetical protein